MLVRTIAHAKLVLARFMRPEVKHYSVDSETKPAPGYEKHKKSTLIIGRYRISIWTLCHRGESYSFPTNLLGPEYPTMSEWVEVFEPLFSDGSKEAVFHNFNYDGNAFAEYKAKFKRIWDTLIGCHYANPNFERGLKSRANLYGRHQRAFKSVDQSNMDQFGAYVESDGICTDEFYQQQRYGKVRRPAYITYVTATGKINTVANNMPKLTIVAPNESLTVFERKVIRAQELPFLRSVVRAERRGFPIGRIKIKNIRKKIEKDQTKLLAEIYRLAGRQFKVSSNKQLVQVFVDLGVNITKKTKKGAPSVAYDSLFFLQDQHPIIKKIVKYKQNSKLQSVYIGQKGLEFYCDKHGRIHTTINSVGAKTGRTSSSNPNLQQIPAAKDTYGIRECFEAPKGKSIVCLDFAQIEIRTMAILSKDPELRRVLSDPDGDIHQNTADQFHVDRSPTAKQINFLMLYGGQSYALSNKLTLEGAPTTPQLAQTYIDRYNEVYGHVRRYRKHLLAEHQRNDEVKYLLGRRRYLLDVDWSSKREIHKAETTLSNNINQGSAQDLLKHSIIRCDFRRANPDEKALIDFDFSPLYRARIKDYARKLEKYRREFKLAKVEWALQVHDESLFFADTKAVQDIAPKIAEIMTWMPFIQPIVPIDVPIVCDGGIGLNWKQAKSKEPIMKVEHFGETMDDNEIPWKPYSYLNEDYDLGIAA